MALTVSFPINKSQLIRVSLLIVCANTFVTRAHADVAPSQPYGSRIQNGVVGTSTVTILTDETDDITKTEERKCGKHCNESEENIDIDDIDDDNDHRYQDGEDDDDEDDDDFDDNGVDLVDQRQNGTENYRIRVKGLLLIITPPELPMPTPTTTSTEAPPLIPPTAPSTNSNATAWNGAGVKKRFNVRRHGQISQEQQKRKLSRYQARIPQFIMALLRNHHSAQQHNH